MNTAENKQLLQHVFAEMSNGNTKPFGEILADDVRWTIIGRTKYSKTYEGKQTVYYESKQTVYKELLEPLFSQFANQYANQARRFVAEADYIVVEARGRVTTKTGKEYNNEYCYIFRFADGKVRELTEYFDTAMIDRTLE